MGQPQQLAVDFPALQIPAATPQHRPLNCIFYCTFSLSHTLCAYPSLNMPYPETTDAFAVTDIKNWSNFTRKEVRLPPGFPTNRIADRPVAPPQEV